MEDADVISGSEMGYLEFLLMSRKRIGRPLGDVEAALAHVAYASGFAAGADWAYRDIEANMPTETEAG
jgi:hypothetical protein